MMTTNTTPTCPDCGGTTRERVSNIAAITRWWSCTRYPACRGKVREYRRDVERRQLTDDLGRSQQIWTGATPSDRPAPTAPTVPAKSKFMPSKYQQAIFDWIRTGTGHAVVEAVAGSGKTTTMVQALGLTSGKVLFTAFNAAIAKELSRRAPAHVSVSTLHSLGLRACRKAFPGIAVDQDGEKVDAITTRAFPIVPTPTDRDGNREVRALARKAISLTKATLTEARDTAAVLAMFDRYGLEADNADDLGRVAGALPGMMDACLADTARVDFDDMVWFPVALGLGVAKHDWVFIDETQDLNRNQLELILKAVKPTGRIVAVGDRNQSIYGFRGADSEAIPRIIDRLGARVFPLSITYRCPVSHVKAAQTMVPHLEARDGAPEGTISEMMIDKALGGMESGDLVMCRTNAPLVSVAFGLIAAGRKAVIRGREIGKGLIGLIRKLAGRTVTDTSDLLTALTTYATKERTKLEKAKKSTAALDDKVECVMALAEGVDTVAALIHRTESIFSDDSGEGVVCSSVHRAKGLEADRTFILKPELMPHPSAKQAWELDQERNIQYVAYTRSKRDMVFVTVPE